MLMDRSEKPFGDLVSLALTQLIGLDLYQGIVSTFGLYVQRDATDSTRIYPVPIARLGNTGTTRKVTVGFCHDGVGRYLCTMEVTHDSRNG